jgi:proteasome accessory factor B
MSKYKPQHSRLLFVDRKIREGGYPSCQTMAEEWEVTRKTIQRDVTYMKYELDAPIEYIAKERGYQYNEPNYQLPAMEVREGDLFAIYLAEKLLAQYKGTPVHDNLASVFAKIADSLPEKVQQPGGQDFAKFTFLSAPMARLGEGVWETVFECLKKQRCIQFDYQSFSPDGESSLIDRTLDPYHAVRHGGDWYVIGHCHVRGEVRTFNLARMTDVVACDASFKLPCDFDVEEFTRGQFGIYQGGEAEWVEVRFSARVAGYIKEKEWHGSQELIEQEDGSLILRLQVSHRLELKRWLLGWGVDAVVLEPDDFVREMGGEVEEMLQVYRKVDEK